MKKRQVGFMVIGVLFFILLSFGLSWAQNPTLLIVVRADDDTLWKMTCDEMSCSAFSSFPGLFRYQPTVTWDEATQEWVVVGTASDNSIWMSTFDKEGNFNNNWQSLPGLTPTPAGLSSSLYKLGGDIKTDRWLNRDSNTFIGVGVAGAGNLAHTTGNEGYYNTAFGCQSLYSNTTGFLNTASGYVALKSNTTGHRNTASGYAALYDNTTGNDNTASGFYALDSNTTGSYNTALGVQAGYTANSANANTTGSNNTFIGAQSGPGTSTQLANATAIGYKALVSTDNSLVLGATGADQVNVGIGTETPGWMLHVNGTAAKPGGGAWTDTSDIRLKKSVRTIENAMGKILALRGVEFEWNGNERARLLPGTQMGMIAQEVEAVFPQWVGTDRQGYKDLTIRGFEALTVEAMRELRAENEALKNRLSDLERRLLLLEGRVIVSK